MPLVKTIEDARLVFIDTEIGRGHPGYLDGTLARVTALHPDLPVYRTNVFAASRGLSEAGWRAIRATYRIGGKGGVITALYGLLRRSAGAGDSGGLAAAVLGRDLYRLDREAKGIVVVSHPILAGMLAPVGPVVYQHGELAVPAEAIVRGCRKILVPWSEAAANFERSGIPASDIAITGQCIEQELTAGAESAYRARIERLNGSDPLTIALFSSGAYPSRHLKRLYLAACSLAAAGQKPVIFCGHSHRMAKALISRFRRRGLSVAESLDFSAGVRVIVSATWADENRMTAELFPRLDLFVAPAHERTNWAVGLGLPQYILCPHIGSYAPLNAGISVGRGVAVELRDDNSAAALGSLIVGLRQTGRLAAMAASGFGRTAIAGFDHSAELLAEMIAGRQEDAAST